MKHIILGLAVAGLCGLNAHATDVNSDVEDLSVESDAAVAETQSVKAEMVKDKSDAEKAHQSAKNKYEAAAAKRAQAVEAMNRTQKDLQSLSAEQARLKSEMEKMKTETAAAEKATKDNKAKIEKVKAENLALEDLKREKTANIAALNAARDKMIIEMQNLDDQRSLADKDFQKLRVEEKSARSAHDQTAQTLTQKQAVTAAHFAELKEKSTVAPAVAPPPVQVATVERAPSIDDVQRLPAASLASNEELTLKKDCKIYDKPTKGLKVIGIKFNGTTVMKSEEGSNWIAFKMSDGQKGFASKTCF